MSTPASQFQFGLEMAEERRARREAVQDEERQAELGTIAISGLSPEAQEDAIRTLYAKDPSALKQHISNLVGRLVGRKPKPVQPMAYAPQSATTQPAPMTIGGMTLPAPRPVTVSYPGARTQAERRAQDLSGARTQQQQTLDAYKAQLGANLGFDRQEDQQSQQAATDLIRKYVPVDQQPAALEDYARRQAGIVSSLKNIPGAAGQPYRNASGQWVRPVQQNDGSIVEQWMPAGYQGPTEKPMFRTIGGRALLLNPRSGALIRDLGPAGTARITRRQTLEPGDDGQMHLVMLTSITTPDGATIDVQPDEATAASVASKGPAPRAQAAPGSSAPGKRPAPKSPANAAPPAIQKPGKGPAPRAGSTSGGPVVPGFSTLARSKNPLFRSDVAAYTKLNEDANTKEEAYSSAKAALASGSTPSSDQELIYSWVRANVQGAGRMTQAEFRQAASVGSLPERAQIAWEKTKSGKLPPAIEQMFLADIQRSAQVARQTASDAKAQLQGPAQPASGTPPPRSGTPPPAPSGFNWSKYPQ
jgi:hypothetical protein